MILEQTAYFNQIGFNVTVRFFQGHCLFSQLKRR